MRRNYKRVILCSGLAILLGVARSEAAGKYDPGASDSEIKIGQTMSYSGPNSSFGVIGTVFAGYFRKVNDEGGIRGRKINFISYDDAFNPAKTVEQTRRLVESDKVLFTVGSLGTALQLAVQKYMNSKKVPQLFISGASSRWEDPEHFPWTMGYVPSYRAEGRIYARMLLKEKPDAKIAILYQNDDYGRDLIRGVKDVFGERAASLIVAEEAFEITEPTIDTHIVKLKASGADTFFDFTPPKFAAQTIRKVAEIGWKPFHVLNTVSSSIATVLQPAGLENAEGIVSTAHSKDPSDPRWDNDPGMNRYKEFVKKYVPAINPNDFLASNAYDAAQTIVLVLNECGDDLTRENVMKHVANIKGLHPDGKLPGIDINTSPTDYAPMESLQVMNFQKDRWVPVGDVISGELDPH
ncbi:ABC transporter substrate-binding protein [Bradyrhizobium sp. WYCCWR 13022]|uniref:ABC transporter substrate-binding protein n=1 Tax=unclassified Bradyrhizobium TaxID=2631580 RepID=UPI00263BE736|nr:ABC transporter substrate-binding protein [Bradyrhizobium sp. WYCCWR 13022]MDN4984302.1 ABC transporter substrate-binding protein [Bradyrhizobium sp. WYCCWR 13022]